MSSWEFNGSEPIEIVASIAAGTVTIETADTDVTRVSLESERSGRGCGLQTAQTSNTRIGKATSLFGHKPAFYSPR